MVVTKSSLQFTWVSCAGAFCDVQVRVSRDNKRNWNETYSIMYEGIRARAEASKIAGADSESDAQTIFSMVSDLPKLLILRREYNMKFNMKVSRQPPGCSPLAGTSQAAIVNAPFRPVDDGELFISIFRDTATPESMIIDTGLAYSACRPARRPHGLQRRPERRDPGPFLATAPSTAFRFNAGGS